MTDVGAAPRRFHWTLPKIALALVVGAVALLWALGGILSIAGRHKSINCDDYAYLESGGPPMGQPIEGDSATDLRWMIEAASIGGGDGRAVIAKCWPGTRLPPPIGG